MAHIEPARRRKDGYWWTRVCYRAGGRNTPLLREPICGYATEKKCLEAATHWANDFERRKYLNELTPIEAGATLTCGEVVEQYLEYHVCAELAGNSRTITPRRSPPTSRPSSVRRSSRPSPHSTECVGGSGCASSPPRGRAAWPASERA